jgi:hypothetical protein
VLRQALVVNQRLPLLQNRVLAALLALDLVLDQASVLLPALNQA